MGTEQGRSAAAGWVQVPYSSCDSVCFATRQKLANSQMPGTGLHFFLSIRHRFQLYYYSAGRPDVRYKYTSSTFGKLKKAMAIVSTAALDWHIRSLDALSCVAQSLPRRHVEPTAIAISAFLGNGEPSIGRLVAPRAIHPEDIAPATIPSWVRPGAPLIVTLVPALSDPDPWGIRQSLDSLVSRLQVSATLKGPSGQLLPLHPTFRSRLPAADAPSGCADIRIGVGSEGGVSAGWELEFAVSLEGRPVQLLLKDVDDHDGELNPDRAPPRIVTCAHIRVGVKHGPSISATAYHAAAAGETLKLCRALREGGSTGERPEGGRGACLFVAAARGHTGAVALLVYAGAPPNALGDAPGGTLCGQTPLHAAVAGGHAAAVEALLAAPGILVNAPDESGVAPLHLAAMLGGNRGRSGVVGVRLLRLLSTARGADANVRNRLGQSPLHLCVIAGWLEGTIALLATAGVDVNAADNDGATPLHLASSRACLDALLAAPGVAVGAHASDGTTPLHAAVARNNRELVATLCIAAGVNVDARDARGRTPLHHAAMLGFPACADALLRAGADRGAVDDVGQTPLSAVGASIHACGLADRTAAILAKGDERPATN